MPDIRSIFDKHGRYQDAMVGAFESHLREMVRRAQARIIGKLQAKLSFTDGKLDNTPGNMRVIRTIDAMFMKEMQDLGYPRLIRAFVGEFSGTLPFLEEVIQHLGAQVGQEWSINLSRTDDAALVGFQTSIADGLQNAVSNVAMAAMTRGMFGVGGLEFGDLVAILSEKLETSISAARTIADTGMSTFYRTASAAAFEKIQQGQDEPIQYKYSGPNDKLTRPFCAHLLNVDKVYSREQISGMNNGQLPNVFMTGGGWNCRHQWILDTGAIEARMEKAA
jgi:hypothetical protein